MLIGPRALSLLLAVSRSRVEWTALVTQSGPSDANASWTCTDVLAHIYEFIDGALPAEAGTGKRSAVHKFERAITRRDPQTTAAPSRRV